MSEGNNHKAWMGGPLGAFWVLLALGSTGGLFYSQVKLQDVRLEQVRLAEQFNTLSADSRQQVAQQQSSAEQLAHLAESLEITQKKTQQWEQGKDAWTLMEAKSLIKLAEQRLHYFGDLEVGQSQLEEAKSLLQTISSPSVRVLKEQLTQTLSQLAPLKPLSMESVWVSLNQLRANILLLPQPIPTFVPAALEHRQSNSTKSGSNDLEKMPEGKPEDSVSNWRQSVQSSLKVLQGYVRLQEHALPAPAPVMQMAIIESLHQESLLLIDLAKWAVLSYKPLVYAESMQLLQDKLHQAYGDKKESQVVMTQIKSLVDISFPKIPSLDMLIKTVNETQLDLQASTHAGESL